MGFVPILEHLCHKLQPVLGKASYDYLANLHYLVTLQYIYQPYYYGRLQNGTKKDLGALFYFFKIFAKALKRP